MRQVIRVLSVVLLLGGCTAKPKLSDTGFTGTWARSGFIGGYRSVVSLLKQDDRWLFRWKLDTEDGKWRVRCGWDGQCEEFVDEKRVGTYKFHVTQQAGEDFLTVDCVREDLRDNRQGYHYRDQLVLEPGGLKLSSYTLELNGTAYPRETARRLAFDKVSDVVADPPPGFGS